MKALVGAFNQEKALVGAYSVIVKTDCETDGPAAASLLTAAAGGVALQTLQTDRGVTRGHGHLSLSRIFSPVT